MAFVYGLARAGMGAVVSAFRLQGEKQFLLKEVRRDNTALHSTCVATAVAMLARWLLLWLLLLMFLLLSLLAALAGNP